MTDVDAIIAGLSEDERRVVQKLGPAWGLLPGDNRWPFICYDENLLGEDVDSCLRKGIYEASPALGAGPVLEASDPDTPIVDPRYWLHITPLGLAVRDKLEADNG